MASCASTGMSYRVDAVACHECGRPLPPAVLRRLATDADGTDVVARVRNGSINQVNCPYCDCSGWISIPFLWLDRARLRAVFVNAETWRHDLVAAEREELLALALAGMDESQQQIVLSRLQEVAAYCDIPAALARSDDEARGEHDAAASAKRLVDLARALGDREALACGLLFTGSALVELHNANASLIYFQEANALLSAATLSRPCAETLAHVYEKAGDAYVQLAALLLAAKAYQASAGLFHQLGRSDGEHSTLEQLAGVCSQLGQATLAQTHYRAALACVPPESEAAVRTLCNLGDMLGALASRPDTVLEIAFGGPPSGSDADQSASGYRGDAQADAAVRQEDPLDFVQGLEGMEQGRVIFHVHLEAAGGRPSLLFESIAGDEAVRCLLDARRLARAQGYAELELLTYAQLANLFIAYGMRRAACDSVDIGRRRCAELGQQPSIQALHAMAVVHEDAASQPASQPGMHAR